MTDPFAQYVKQFPVELQQLLMLYCLKHIPELESNLHLFIEPFHKSGIAIPFSLYYDMNPIYRSKSYFRVFTLSCPYFPDICEPMITLIDKWTTTNETSIIKFLLTFKKYIRALDVPNGFFNNYLIKELAYYADQINLTLPDDNNVSAIIPEDWKDKQFILKFLNTSSNTLRNVFMTGIEKFEIKKIIIGGELDFSSLDLLESFQKVNAKVEIVINSQTTFQFFKHPDWLQKLLPLGFKITLPSYYIDRDSTFEDPDYDFDFLNEIHEIGYYNSFFRMTDYDYLDNLSKIDSRVRSLYIETPRLFSPFLKLKPDIIKLEISCTFFHADLSSLGRLACMILKVENTSMESLNSLPDSVILFDITMRDKEELLDFMEFKIPENLMDFRYKIHSHNPMSIPENVHHLKSSKEIIEFFQDKKSVKGLSVL